jgi:ParB family chromosome partitioning protein
MEVAMPASEQETGLKRRLGRGLNALLGSGDPSNMEEPAALSAMRDKDEADTVSDEIALELIETNPYQPRKEFDEDGLEELAESIRQHGVLQPLLVRMVNGGYQLIAGERRWRAAQRAQLSTVPCRVMKMDDRGACEAAIEENLKRRDLNVLEKAEAFREYLDHFESTIEELAQHLSMNRSTVSNILRLLELTEPVRNAVKSNLITGGHARALLALPAEQQSAISQLIQSEQWSVRKTEQAVREILNPEPKAAPSTAARSTPTPRPKPSTHVTSLQDQLREKLGVKVEIALKTKDTGKVVLHFGSNDDFERLMRSLRNAA